MALQLRCAVGRVSLELCKTPWGEIEVADAHAHLFSYAFFQTLAGQRGQLRVSRTWSTNWGWEVPPKDNSELATRWVRELDLHFVARTVLMSSVPGDEKSATEIVRACPDRFYGYFMFNPLVPDARAQALRAFDQFGLKGLCLFPGHAPFFCSGRTARPNLRIGQ